MSIDPLEYYRQSDWALMMAEAKKHVTPFLVVNLDIVRMKYRELKELFPYAHIYYAVKSNPAVPVLEALRDMGSCFDIASVYELDKVLSLGIAPDRTSFGNTIKKAADIRYAYKKGVRLFATDSEADLRNLAREAPGSRVFFRILAEGADTADWPLSRKFGCHPDMVTSLILLARDLKLKPCGISFHVGSQQRDIGTWDAAIAKVRYIFDYLETVGIHMTLINMGGGFPANYISKTSEMETYAKEITRYISEDFGEEFPEIILEPGRSMVGDAGVLATEVVLVSQKSHLGVDKWLYLDTGKFNGLIETWDESIKYPLYCERKGSDCEDFIIAGPTCDSQDVMYEKFRNPLPRNIAIGDRIYWLTTGAYTGSYCAVEFNGFPPLPVYFVDSEAESDKQS